MSVGSVNAGGNFALGSNAESPEEQSYTVQRGDTLWAIAKQNGVSLSSLIAANPQIVNPDLIYPDQEINIPSGGQGSESASPDIAASATTPTAETYQGGPLSRVQLAQVFHQAGFRGENLVNMVAIAMRESRGNPQAFNGDGGTGDLSYGLTQINMLGSLGPARREQLGLTSNEQLFDPLTNAKAAFALSNNGTDLSPWGGYKGQSNTYNTDIGAARAAVEQAESQGLLGLPFQDGPDAAAPGPSAINETGASNASKPTLRIGARGEAVADLQQQLKAAGFNPGPVDGWFGPQTQAAVKDFQAARGIVVDGWVGRQTWGELERGGNQGTPTPAASPTGSATPVSGVADPRMQNVLNFGLSNIGAPYVGGASPSRFGQPGDGSTHQQAGQKVYLSPEGVVGFDCSGLVVAMYRQAGVDLAARGIANTRTMHANLPSISRNDLQPGDLIVKPGSHVVIYLGDQNGDGRPEVLEATPKSQNPDGSYNGVMVSDASKYLNDPDYDYRRVPLP
jgi:spore coat assembly protein SafA